MKNLKIIEIYALVQKKIDLIIMISAWNYRYTNIQAALGLSQLKRIGKIVIKKKHEIGNYYFKSF